MASREAAAGACIPAGCTRVQPELQAPVAYRLAARMRLASAPRQGLVAQVEQVEQAAVCRPPAALGPLVC